MRKTHSINIEREIAAFDESTTKIFAHLNDMERSVVTIRSDLAEISRDVHTMSDMVNELISADDPDDDPVEDHTVSIMVIT